MKLELNQWRQRLRDAANRAGIPRFWRWWMSELAPLLPGAWRAALQRRFTRPVIELAQSEAVIWRPEFTNGTTRLAISERVSLIGDAAAVLAAGRAAMARIAARASGGIAVPRVVVALGPHQVLRKEFTLPAAVEENLAQTLAYDLDRHTPFRPEQLYFDAVVVARDTAKRTIRVDWVAALKTVVEDARKQIEAWGAIPIAVVPGPPQAGTRLNLIPGTSRARTLQWRRWQVLAPLAVVAAIAIAAVLVPLVQKRQYAIALNAANAAAAQRALAADAVRQQLEGMQGDYNYILAKKYTYPSVVHVLDEVTRVLPDDTWLTQLEVKTSGRGKETQRDLYLRGESANAGKLIALLEDSKLVEQAAPRSPTTKIQGASGEIFDLSARLRTLPPPAPVALAAGEAPAPAPAPALPAQPAVSPAAAEARPPVTDSASMEETAPAAETAPGAETAPAPGRERRGRAGSPVAPGAAQFGPLKNAPILPPSATPPRERGTPAATKAPPPAAAPSAPTAAPSPAVAAPAPPAAAPAPPAAAPAPAPNASAPAMAAPTPDEEKDD